MRIRVAGIDHDLATFRFVVTCFLVLVIAFGVGQWLTISTLRHERARRVVAINTALSRQCNVLADIISASDTSLGKPGAPGYAYYTAHPDELKAAHKANAAIIARLDCGPQVP